MMIKKIILIVLIALTSTLSLNAKEKAVCSMFYVKRYISQLPDGLRDKTKHCTISCQLANRCSEVDVYAIGYLKEFLDLLGLGEPSKADLLANKQGILYSRTYRVNECLDVCFNHYE